MDPLEKSRGGYEIGKERLTRKRDLIINFAEEFIPDNIDEVLATVDEGETDLPLDWVVVPDPSNEKSTLEVLPSIYLWKGDDENPSGMYQIIMSVKVGNEEVPLFSIATKQFDDYTGVSLNGDGELPWDSSDTELFLDLAESAFMAQQTK